LHLSHEVDANGDPLSWRVSQIQSKLWKSKTGVIQDYCTQTTGDKRLYWSKGHRNASLMLLLSRSVTMALFLSDYTLTSASWK